MRSGVAARFIAPRLTRSNKHVASRLGSGRVPDVALDHRSERDRIELDAIVARAQLAQRAVTDWDEVRMDALLADLSDVVSRNARALATAAVAETRMGNVADKTRKIEFAARQVFASLAGRVARGVIGSDGPGVTAIASPVGVVLGVLPVTNPVATMINKILISLKSRNALVLSPHRRAQGVSGKALALVAPLLRAHGAPSALVQLVPGPPSRHRTSLLMGHENIALILATGGAGVVRAAYRSGTPAIGVGPGNAPAYVAGDADLPAAAPAIVEGKSFDHGIICGSEQHVVVDDAIAPLLLAELRRAGAATLDPEETHRLIRVAFDTSTGVLRSRWIGRSAPEIASAAGVYRRHDFRLLVFPAAAASVAAAARRERLAPIVSLHTVRDATEGIRLCQALLAEDGAGHTAVVHSRSRELVARFAEALPVSRLLVNSPAGLACIGVDNGLTPSFTLGCGTFGGTSTTDNVGYLNLLNIKRIACPLANLPTAGDEQPSTYESGPHDGPGAPQQWRER